MASQENVSKAMEWYDKNIRIYENCAKTKAELIRQILNKRMIPYHSITYRAKERKSFENKCLSDKYTNPIDEIMDLSGVRIIAYTNKEVQKICKVIKEEFEIDEKNSMDKASLMAENQVGYLSVHYIVKLKENRTSLFEYQEYDSMYTEIQVRTLLQHTWAEIEHDKNYKFSGVLPTEIKRRFYLISGVLELIDREFDVLSDDIDKYIKLSKDKVSKGDYEMPLDSKTLEQYMIQKYSSNESTDPIINNILANETIVNELLKFGFTTIQEIDDVLTDDMRGISTTYIGILRNMMIIKDAKKYFEEAFDGAWSGTNKKTLDYWNMKTNADIGKYLKERDMIIAEE